MKPLEIGILGIIAIGSVLQGFIFGFVGGVAYLVVKHFLGS